MEQKPEKVSADLGYFREANLTDEPVKDVDLYVATGRNKHGDVVETIVVEKPSGSVLSGTRRRNREISSSISPTLVPPCLSSSFRFTHLAVSRLVLGEVSHHDHVQHRREPSLFPR
jgi:hypothetical protein